MAKTVRTNRSKGIVAVSHKNQYIERMKALTKYLVQPDDRLLHKIISDPNDAKKLKYRSISYLVFHPKLISYINKYLNSKFEFNRYDPELWFRTISQVCKLYGLSDTNSLYFSKFKTDEHNEFIKLMRKYYAETEQCEPSPSELNALFILRRHNIIDDEIMAQMKFIIDGKVVKTTKEKKLEQMIGFQPAVAQTNAPPDKDRDFKSLSPNVQKYCGTIQAYIKTRQACRGCPLFTKGSVILDTNLKEVGPVDIMIMGLNPGKDEIDKGIPFIGRAGQVLRRLLNPLLERLNLTYVITNCILCYTNNESEIAKPKVVSNNCKQIVDEIVRQFNPKVKIVLGDKAVKSVGIKGGITKLNGTFVDDYFVMIHPSAVLYNPNNNLPKFQKAFMELEKMLSGGGQFETSRAIPQAPAVCSIPQDKIVSRFSPNLTLFDIRIVDEQLVYILKDKAGVKKYLIESIQFPVFVKGGKYSECGSFESHIQGVAHLTSEERSELNSKLYHNLRGNMKL